MKLITAYNHLVGYLHRWKLIEIGRFMLRIHRILDCDRTPFLHTHPFSYVSVVLRGGYTERYLSDDGKLTKVSHRFGSVIFRRNTTPHRIDSVSEGCTTLFFVWKTTKKGEQGWGLFSHPNVNPPTNYWSPDDWIYQFKNGWRKRHDGKWFALRPTRYQAMRCDRLALRQDIHKSDLL